MRKGIQTDHEFQTGHYCDCDSCCQLCDYHYGLEDACVLEHHMHADYRNVDCGKCGRMRVQSNGVCEKCGYNNDTRSY